MASQVDWQISCPDIRARMAHLYETKIWTDVEFLVGVEPNAAKITAHKFVLSASSPVFEAMFNGGYTESNDALIRIPDLNPQEFEKILRFIYTDEHNMKTVDEVILVFYGAKKYLLDSLAERCVEFVTSILSPENVLKAHEFATFYEKTALIDACINLMTTQTTDCIQAESFVNSDLHSVIALFSQTRLAISSELDLVQALEKYAANDKNEVLCAGLKIGNGPVGIDAADAVGTEKLPTIRGAVKRIRWLTFQPSEIAPLLSETNLLTEQEKLDILLNVCSIDVKRAMPAGFDTTRKTRILIYCYYCKRNLTNTTYCSRCGRYIQ